MAFHICCGTDLTELVHEMMVNTSQAAKVQKQAIEKCPLLVSANAPYDYEVTFGKKLNVELAISVLKLLSINDLTKT